MRIGTGRAGPGEPMSRAGPATATVVVVPVVAVVVAASCSAGRVAAGRSTASGSPALPPDPSAAITATRTATNAAIRAPSASARARRSSGVGESAIAGHAVRDMPPIARLVGELRGAIDDERVLDAIRAVPREAFVPRALRARAYDNVALPIGAGQTISQPLV